MSGVDEDCLVPYLRVLVEDFCERYRNTCRYPMMKIETHLGGAE